MSPIPDTILPPEPEEDPLHAKEVQESCNQLSRDYQDAWERHLKRLEKIGVK